MQVDHDLSVIVTAHDETLVCGPTMRAAEAAIDRAIAEGHSVERIIVLDNATPDTRAFFTQSPLAHWRVIDSTEGDLGRTRNFVLPQTRGRFIAFLDADDLFSENWLSEGIRALNAAESEGRRAIAHPELNWLFDGANSVFWKPGQEDPLFLPQHFYFMNYYDSLCMAPRAAHEAVPYVHRDIPGGLSFQDWQFAIESMSAGWDHLSVRDTIIFKRRRDNSLVSESRGRQAILRPLEAMAIDRIADLAGPRPQPPAPTPRTGQPPNPFPAHDASDNMGRVLAARLDRAEARSTAAQQDPERGLEYGDDYAPTKTGFDLAWYLSRHADLFRAERLDPVGHYLRAGEREGRRPNASFDPKAYARRNPDLAEAGQATFAQWRQSGWAEGRVAAPYAGFETLAEALGVTPQQAEDLWMARYSDLRARLQKGDLGAQALKAARFEPLIEAGWREALQLKMPPFHSEMVADRSAAMIRAQAAAGGKRARFVICVNRARWGGSRRAEGHLAHALADLHGAENLLLITTDKSGPLPEGKLPKGARHVDLAAITEALDLKPAPRQRLLVELLRSLCPEIVFNINSRLLWDALGPYGRALSSGTRLISWLLCNEQNEYGHWTGYPLTRFYRHFDVLERVITDSDHLANELRNRHMLPPAQADRVLCLPHPMRARDVTPAPVRDADPDTGRRPQIFWAGRFDPQKRVDLVYAIAQAMPECDVRMWGEFVMGRAAGLPAKPANVTHEGTYARFDDLPLSESDLWLYTSQWDGVPQMLLEVCAAGLPVVGSAVGGCPEVLRNGLARSLPPEAPVSAWTTAIRAALADPDAARKSAKTLRESLLSERTETAYRAAVADLIRP
jgi:glycosyltransferase involved in cell wall biosynthesis